MVDNSTNSGNAEEMKQIDKFNSSLVDKGALIQAVGIASPDNAFTIDNRSGKAFLEQASLNSSPFYSGFWLVSAESLEKAKEIANGASLACNRVVELRPLL